MLENASYSDEHGSWKVLTLIHHMRKLPARRVQVETLLPCLDDVECDEPVGSVEFEIRSRRSDLRYPLLLVQDQATVSILDGCHRLWKAHKSRRTHVWARVIPLERLLQIPQDPEK